MTLIRWVYGPGNKVRKKWRLVIGNIFMWCLMNNIKIIHITKVRKTVKFIVRILVRKHMENLYMFSNIQYVDPYLDDPGVHTCKSLNDPLRFNKMFH